MWAVSLQAQGRVEGGVDNILEKLERSPEMEFWNGIFSRGFWA